MTNKALSIFNQLRPLSVGFDDVFDHFESMFDSPGTFIGSSYPPYNLVKTGTHKFDIEIALAGFNKKDIEITSENNILTIESKVNSFGESLGEAPKKDKDVIHKGISKRYFKRSFTIADDIEIKGAELKDGLLKVSMEKIIPDAKKLKTISIK